MTVPALFDYQGKQVRSLTIDGEPWFVASDACAVLEIANPRSSLALLDEDEKGVHTVYTPGGDQQVSIISEAGLYSLILRSRRPEAKAFKRWVTHKLIPTARRHGLPQKRAELSRLELIEIARASELERLALEKQVAELEPKVEAAEATIAKLEPKAAYVDTFVSGDTDATLLRVLAGQLNVPEQKLRRHLIANSVIYRKDMGSRWSMSQGRNVAEYQELAHARYRPWFVPMDQPKAPPYPNGQMRTTLYVTPAGKVGIHKMLTRKPLTGGAA